MNKLSLLIFVFIPALAYSQSPETRTKDWRNHLHYIGENYLDIDQVITLLGKPDNLETIKTTTKQYASSPTLSCVKLPIGTNLKVIYYRDNGILNSLYFKNNKMQCFSAEPVNTGSPP